MDLELVRGTAEAPTMHGPYVTDDAETILAYSADTVLDYPPTGPQPQPEPEPAFRGAAAKAAAAALAVAFGAAAVILFTYPRPTSDTKITLPTPVTVTATVQREPTVQRESPTPETHAGETPDQKFLRLFEGLTASQVTDSTPIIALGHAQCYYLQTGGTPNAAAAALMSEYSDVTRQTAYGIVEAAVLAYCPQYKPEL